MSRKSIQIGQGFYLADRDPIASLTPSDYYAEQGRPVPLPRHEPQSSQVYPSSKHWTTRRELQPIPEVQDEESVNSVSWYHGNTEKAANRLGTNTTRRMRTRLSLTPSVFQLGAGALSVEQAKELARLRDTPAELDDKAVDSADEPPDGGALAWAHAAVGHFVVFNAQGLNMAYGVFQAYYQDVLPDKSPSQIAWIGSSQIFLIFFMSIIVSPLMDKGHFRLCFNGGSLLLVLSVLGTSFCTEWWQLLLIQGVSTGIAMGLIFGSGVIVLMSYFSKHLGLATGIAAAGGSTGGIFFPIIADRLINRVGYAWTVRAIALVVLLTLIPANIVVQERPGYKSKRKTTMDWSALRDIPFLLMAAGMFFAYWGVYFGFYYIAAYGEQILHLSPSDSINLLVAMNAANLPGRFLPNLISDACIGPLNTIIPATFLTAMQIFVWIGTSTHASLVVVACLYGFAAAGLQGLYNATIYSFSPDISKVGIRMAMVFVLMGVACFTGTPLGGLLIDVADGGYLYAQLFSGCSILVGALLLLAARLAKAGWTPDRV